MSSPTKTPASLLSQALANQLGEESGKDGPGGLAEETPRGIIRSFLQAPPSTGPRPSPVPRSRKAPRQTNTEVRSKKKVTSTTSSSSSATTPARAAEQVPLSLGADPRSMLTSLLSVLPDGTLSPNDQANVLADLQASKATLTSPTPDAPGGGFASPANVLASMPQSTRDLVLRRLSQAPVAERTAAQAARRAAQAAAAEPATNVLSAAAKAALVAGHDTLDDADLPYDRPTPLSDAAIVGFDDDFGDADGSVDLDVDALRARLAPKGRKRGRTPGSVFPRKRPTGLQPMRKTIVRTLVRDSLPPGMRLDPDAIPVVQEASLDFLDAALEDVAVYASHRRGTTFTGLETAKCSVGDDDVLLLLQRQRATSAKKSANALARELLPPEVVEEMLAVARAHNVVDPTGADRVVAPAKRLGRPKRSTKHAPAL